MAGKSGSNENERHTAIDSNGSENSRIAKDYKVRGVPHYVLIDKHGRIASAFAPMPSMEAEVEKQINELLQE